MRGCDPSQVPIALSKRDQFKLLPASRSLARQTEQKPKGSAHQHRTKEQLWIYIVINGARQLKKKNNKSARCSAFLLFSPSLYSHTANCEFSISTTPGIYTYSNITCAHQARRIKDTTREGWTRFVLCGKNLIARWRCIQRHNVRNSAQKERERIVGETSSPLLTSQLCYIHCVCVCAYSSRLVQQLRCSLEPAANGLVNGKGLSARCRMSSVCVVCVCYSSDTFYFALCRALCTFILCTHKLICCSSLDGAPIQVSISQF